MAMTFNTINAEAHVRHNGREILVEGPIRCDKRETLRLRVTISQKATGAIAEGDTEEAATGGFQCWEVVAKCRGEAVFEEGWAQASVLGTTWLKGRITDVAQWAGDLVLMDDSEEPTGNPVPDSTED